MDNKYFKPLSLTWWASVAPIIAGVFLAAEPVHQMAALVDVVRELVGNASPGVLINAGLAGIGIRGALK